MSEDILETVCDLSLRESFWLSCFSEILPIGVLPCLRKSPNVFISLFGSTSSPSPDPLFFNFPNNQLNAIPIFSKNTTKLTDITNGREKAMTKTKKTGVKFKNNRSLRKLYTWKPISPPYFKALSPSVSENSDANNAENEIVSRNIPKTLRFVAKGKVVLNKYNANNKKKPASNPVLVPLIDFKNTNTGPVKK